jgi:Domain of unknown function (DUF5076)
MHANQLPVPPAAETDARAVELLRVWAADGKQHVSLATNLWNDPAAWGIMLVDLAKHVASAYQQSEGKEFLGVLTRIKEGFDAEWETATDQPSGNLLD